MAANWKVKMARLLARSFEHVNYSTEPKMAFDSAAAWLDIKPEEVEMLVFAGLLKKQEGNWVALKDLVRFIEKTGWIRIRAGVQTKAIKARVGR